MLKYDIGIYAQKYGNEMEELRIEILSTYYNFQCQGNKGRKVSKQEESCVNTVFQWMIFGSIMLSVALTTKLTENTMQNFKFDL